MGRGHRAEEAVGFVSHVLRGHPAPCHPPVELLPQRQPGLALGLSTEVMAFEIHPVFGLAVPFHLLCTPKYEKDPQKMAQLGRFLPVPFSSGLSTSPHQTKPHFMPTDLG